MQRLLVVDDHPMCGIAVRHAVCTFDSAIEVVDAATLQAAETKLKEGGWGLVILDLMLPDSHGLSGLATLKSVRSDVPIAVISSRDEPELVRRAVRLGTRGYISKAIPLDEMARALRVLLAGGQWLPDGILSGDTEPDVIDFSARLSTLSNAQLRVLRGIADGHQNKQIAYDLGLSEATVKTHLAAIFRKLGVTNRTQAVLALRESSDAGGQPLD